MNRLIISSLLLLLLLLPTNLCFSILPNFIKLLLNNSQDDDESQIVTLKNGARIRGINELVPGKKPMYFFRTIRYGEIRERFGLPQPVKQWNDIYDATYFRNGCPQNLPFISTDEDCLFLNIWTHNIYSSSSSSKNLLRPVIFYIPGTGFDFGNIKFLLSKLFDGSNYVDFGNFVFVSIQHRLGPFGFLYSGNERAPGNQGVHDIILGLQWVKENIDRFGGNPNDITLMGLSSGSMAISTLILSPLARGLFHRGIMNSGSISDYYNYSPERMLNFSKKYAQKCNCPVDNPDHMIDCLQSKSVNELIELRSSFNLSALFTGNVFLMMYGDQQKLLPEQPSKMLANNDYNPVDLISGFNNGEQGVYLDNYFKELRIDSRKMNINDVKQSFYKFCKIVEHMSEFCDKIFQFFTRNMNDNPFRSDVQKALSHVLSDSIFTCPSYLFTQKYARALARNSSNSNHKVYSYRYDHHSPYISLLFCPKRLGICHGTDSPIYYGLAYYTRILSFVFTATDKKLSYHVMKSFSNFIENSEPGHFMDNLEWPEFRSIESNGGKNISWKQMAIDSKPNIIITDAYVEQCRFWEPFLSVDDPIN
ncbi:cholinesterase-like [Dermatophagoides pteronyssinus]|uniref:cholinesterase-like n=1 Tax=Dermatophagoides pteronyssinus TaxID=6956 RepID=UPI003F662716